VFRTAFRDAKAVDPEWLAAEDAKRAVGSPRRSKDRPAERSLRDRVREQLGMQEWRTATDPKVPAQELGIEPSYDLKDGVSDDASSGDPKLQNLVLPGPARAEAFRDRAPCRKTSASARYLARWASWNGTEPMAVRRLPLRHSEL
jgi:hypothetical protein